MGHGKTKCNNAWKLCEDLLVRQSLLLKKEMCRTEWKGNKRFVLTPMFNKKLGVIRCYAKWGKPPFDKTRQTRMGLQSVRCVVEPLRRFHSNSVRKIILIMIQWQNKCFRWLITVSRFTKTLWITTGIVYKRNLDLRMNVINKCFRMGWMNERRSSNLLLSKRWKTTMPADPTVGIEVGQAKSYDEIPGACSLPLIGTAWTMLPVIGVQI